MKYLLALLVILNTLCSLQSSKGKKNGGDLSNMIQSGKDIFIENQVFQQDVDFTKMLDSNLISEGIYQAKTTSSVTFKNCRFEGKLTAFINKSNGQIMNTAFLSNVSFINCIFNNEVSFRSGSIYGMTNFTKSVFNKKANFEECTFYQNAYFNGCNFADEVRFQNAFFIKKANFMNAQFAKVAGFQNSTVNAELQFSVAKFGAYADFSLLKCNENAFFNYCEFSGKSSFSNAKFAGRTDFLKVKFKTGDFKNTAFFGEPRFFDSSVADSISFDNTFFLFAQPDLSFFPKEKINITNLKKRQ